MSDTYSGILGASPLGAFELGGAGASSPGSPVLRTGSGKLAAAPATTGKIEVDDDAQ